MSDTGAQDIAQVEVEFKIRINYKSGHQYTGWFTEFKIESASGKLTSLSYKHSEKSNFIFIGIHDIESIVQVEHRKKAVNK